MKDQDARHDWLAMSEAEVSGAFKKLIDLESELMVLFEKRAKQHQAMLSEIG